ncbi:NUDIX domain-containing protein [Persicobacter diffluens]|uniref:Nudix hydrolase domain-containing protein n=1 Tax=Persicobacter diffluens TaxID=981 RepID=A0AAN4VX73_9BACT|nr:hypothetical protein PEDI_16540 [Persicobacter diffluens]
MTTEEAIVKTFGGKLRIRVSGLLIENDKCLMVEHHSINEAGNFWGPPGGGLNYAQSIDQALKQEFLEECGIEISVNRFLFFNEFLEPPLHAIELFYEVKKLSSNIRMGFDPELSADNQIIKKLDFLRLQQIQQLPKGCRHSFFDQANDWSGILGLNGHLKNDL